MIRLSQMHWILTSEKIKCVYVYLTADCRHIDSLPKMIKQHRKNYGTETPNVFFFLRNKVASRAF